MSTSRDYQFDNIKGIMLVFVIVAHTITNLFKAWPDHTATRYVFYLAASLPMPLCCFISGYFSKRKTEYGVYLKKAIVGCLIPYFVLNLLYGLASDSFVHAINIFEPKRALWYLLSLFIWKLIVEIYSKIKWSLPLAVFMALFIGIFDSAGTFLSISRVFCFFPFFYAGYLCSSEQITNLRNGKKLLPALSFIIMLILCGMLIGLNIDDSTVYMRDSYRVLGQTYLQGMLFRGILLICGALCAFFFLSCTTVRKTIFSTFGQYSVTIYVFHYVVIRLLVFLKVFRFFSNPYVFLVFAFVFALVLSIALGNKWVARIYHAVMNKIGSLVVR